MTGGSSQTFVPKLGDLRCPEKDRPHKDGRLKKRRETGGMSTMKPHIATLPIHATT